MKSTIVSLKKQILQKGKNLEIKANIFCIPCEVWQWSGFDSFCFRAKDSSMPFTEYAANRNNYEFMKEFNTLNENQAHLVLLNSKTGDKMQVNKGFLKNIMDSDDIENAENG
jgi:hypothetical protein